MNCDVMEDEGAGAGAYDDYEEDEGTDRRLRRSQIIQSFLQQSDFSLDEEPEEDDMSEEVNKKSEPATITTRI